MWCKLCGQDVPGRPDEGGKLSCPRCSGILDSGTVPTAPTLYDGWEMDEQLRHIERVLVSNRLRSDQPAAAERGMVRTDAPHAGARPGTSSRRNYRRRALPDPGRPGAAGSRAW